MAMLVFLSAPASLLAGPLDQELTALKEKLSKDLVRNGPKKVAALDFTDLQGRRNELGRFLAEQLTVELVGTEKISVVDRANLKSILEEIKLTEEGLVNPENAKKLGQFSGLDAILIGTLSANQNDVVLLVKAVSTDTAEVVAAGKATFQKTEDLQRMMSASLSTVQSATVSGSAAAAQSAAASTDTPVIATKEIGPLRITLKNVSQLRKASGDRDRGRGASVTGAVCALEFSNTDLQRPVKVAYNAAARVRNGSSYVVRRSKLTDASGQTWRLIEATGLPMITCGRSEDPTAIVRLIEQVPAQIYRELFNNDGETAWAGEFLTIEPGKSARISMTFADVDEYAKATGEAVAGIASFQLESELVVGIVDPAKKSVAYRLEGLVFDKVSMPSSEK